MKKPPTLADACITTALDKRFSGTKNAAQLRPIYLDVAKARKFVLDEEMSRFVADLSHSFWSGSERRQTRLLENARLQARLPHHLTWIELHYASYINRVEELKGQGYRALSGKDPERIGWLIRQHPGNEAAFALHEIRATVNVEGMAFLHLLGMAWCADDSPSPWQRFPDDTLETSEAVVAMQGYHSRQAHWSGGVVSAEVLESWLVAASGGNPDAAMVPTLALRTAWAFLATINDLPVKIEEVEPSRGFVSRGSYKKFLKHSVVHLTVPETQYRKLIAKTIVMLRRRAHQVRGHWRKDWRHPLSPLCEHSFDNEVTCTRCLGRKLWVAEHQRGDSSIGFVMHDYEVHHDE